MVKQYNMHNIRKGRAERAKDLVIRQTMGLKYVGLLYGQYGQPALELYVACDQVEYVKLSDGVYDKAINYMRSINND